MVAEFHEKLGISPRQRMRYKPSQMLLQFSHAIHTMAHELERRVNDPDARYLRAHLDLEETAEFVHALACGDEVAALDAMADKLYILCGHADVFDLPLGAAFDEVHRSNMTKKKQPADPSAARVRQKGPNYSPPDLRRVLQEHRDGSRCSCDWDKIRQLVQLMQHSPEMKEDMLHYVDAALKHGKTRMETLGCTTQ
jgi:predicted HAD superfamily Cof-like phosphohydrolase